MPKKKKIISEICNGGIMGIHSSALKYLSKIKKNISQENIT